MYATPRATTIIKLIAERTVLGFRERGGGLRGEEGGREFELTSLIVRLKGQIPIKLDVIVPVACAIDRPTRNDSDRDVAKGFIELLGRLPVPSTEKDQRPSVLPSRGVKSVHQRSPDAPAPRRQTHEQFLQLGPVR